MQTRNLMNTNLLLFYFGAAGLLRSGCLGGCGRFLRGSLGSSSLDGLCSLLNLLSRLLRGDGTLRGGLRVLNISVSTTTSLDNDRTQHTSLAGATLFLGASLTLPEGPLGSAKIFSSAPLAMARLSCDVCRPPISSLYLSSMN